MAIDYSYYTTANSAYGGVHDRDTITTEIQDSMDEDLRHNLITEFDVKIGMEFYRETVLVNFEREMDCIIKFKRMKEAVYNSMARELLCEPGGVKTGDYIKHTNKQNPHDVRIYLVRNMIDPKHGYDSSFILTCQKWFRWVGKDKVIHSFPVSFIDNKTMLGESETQVQTGFNDVQQCFIQENEFTKKIHNGQRFISNTEVFEIVGIDMQTINGLLTLRVKKTGKDEINDNMELEIADYYKVFDKDEIPPVIDPELPPVGYELALHGSDDVIFDFEEYYSLTVYYGGLPITDDVIEWEIINEDGTTNPYAKITNIDGYNCTVKGGKSRYVGRNVILRANLLSDPSVYIKRTIKIVNAF